MAKVLLVDDEAAVRRTLCRMLVNLGHEVSDAADGAAALRLLDADRYDLVLTDVYMAGGDGMELLVRIQQLGRPVPVVVMSGGGFMGQRDLLDMAGACGAVATLEKPITPDKLRQTIEPLLRSPASD